MLDFQNYQKLCSSFTHYRGDKFIELPKDEMNSIGLWSLIDRVTFHEIDDTVDVEIWTNNRTFYVEDSDRIKSVLNNDLFNLVMLNSTDTVILFENEAAAKHYLYDHRINTDKVDILKVDDQLAEELIEKTRQDRMYYCDREISKSKTQLNLLQQHIEDMEALKASL